ncbi:hypothetical protein ATHEMM101B_14930 [Atlantibacter hermannii]|uniref:HEAT repeat domain-containing protein n=1 Tax=Atlantibacter hermannii TaxID=565 RepID=UPI003B272ADF
MDMPDEIIKVLLDKLDSSDKEVCIASLKAIADTRCADRDVAEALEHFSKSDDKDIQIAAINAIGKIYR